MRPSAPNRCTRASSSAASAVLLLPLSDNRQPRISRVQQSMITASCPVDLCRTTHASDRWPSVHPAVRRRTVDSGREVGIPGVVCAPASPSAGGCAESACGSHPGCTPGGATFLARRSAGGPRPAPPWFPAARTHTAHGCPWAGPEPVLHAPLGLLGPALDLGNGEVMLASHFSDGGLALEDVHNHGGFTLRGQGKRMKNRATTGLSGR